MSKFSVRNPNGLGVKVETKKAPDLINHNNTSDWNPETNYSKGAVVARKAPRKPPQGARKLISLPKNPIVAAIQPDGQQVTMVDWLRLTINDLDAFQATMGDLADEGGILSEAGMDVQWKQGKGLHGYSESASIVIWKDNDYMTVGNLAYSEQGQNKGGMFELTGAGCKVLQVEYPVLWLELYSLLSYHDWRISRVDIALDLAGAYCLAQGYTVPKLMRDADENDLFKSDLNKNPNFVPEIQQAGSWTKLMTGRITPDDYDPLVHCPGGLTFYVGSRSGSDDFFRVYEKGKEILGKQAEPESVDRGWVRIEHEMSRKASGRVIPLDVMIRPDEYFCAGRSNVRAIMEAVRKDRELKQIQSWQREQFKKEKSLMLSRKVYWARHTYGRTVRTLIDKGLTADQIIDALAREAGLKEFVFDLLDHAANESGEIEELAA